MGQWGDVFNALHVQAGGLQCGDRALATTAGALDLHFHFLDAELRGLFRSLLGGALAGERRALAASLEATRAGARPAEGVALAVGDRDRGVVERGAHVGHTQRDVASDFASLALTQRYGAGCRSPYMWPC